MKKTLTIAGSDSSGCAGIQADIKTMGALGVFGMSVIAAVTSQNTLGVTYIEELSTKSIITQIEAIYDDLAPDALKSGMLFSKDIIEAVADILKARKSMNKNKANLSDRAKYELSVMIAAATKIISVTNEAFKLNDLDKARKVEPLEDVIDKLKRELKLRHMERIDEGECTVEQGLPYLDIVSSIEHIADHCSDIALTMIELNSGDYNINISAK